MQRLEQADCNTIASSYAHTMNGKERTSMMKYNGTQSKRNRDHGKNAAKRCSKGTDLKDMNKGPEGKTIRSKRIAEERTNTRETCVMNRVRPFYLNP